jgi:transposase
MSHSHPRPAKIRSLRDAGCENPHPERVSDGRFQEEEFFDPHDLVQVRYEMLRRVAREGISVTQAVSDFGCSRPTFYRLHRSYAAEGLPGLLPRKRGPRGAHKLTADVLEIIDQALAADRTLKAPALAKIVAQERGLVVHPRSIERALARRKKKRR